MSVSSRGPPPPPPPASPSHSGLGGQPPPPPLPSPSQPRPTHVSRLSGSAPSRSPPPPPTTARAALAAQDAALAAAAAAAGGNDARPFIPPRPSVAIGGSGHTPSNSADLRGMSASFGAVSMRSMPPTPSPLSGSSNGVRSPGTPSASPTSPAAPLELIPMPEDNPSFWRELNALRSNSGVFSSALDEFMWRTFFPRRKKEEKKEKGGLMFNFQRAAANKISSAVAAATAGSSSANHDKPNPLLQHLSSPTASSSSSTASLSSSGLSSRASNAAQDRLQAAQIEMDAQKNRAFLSSYAHRANAASQPVNEMTALVQQLSLHKSLLDEKLEGFERYASQFADSLATVSHRLSEHDETKRQVLTKLTKYLGHKVGTNVDKALEQEKKIRTRRQLMSSLRFDASCDLKRMTANEELNVLRPLSSALHTYWEFFENGYKMLLPMQASIAGLAEYVRGLEEAAERQSQQVAASKRQHEAGVLASHTAHSSAASTAALTSSLQGSTSGTGIRDLDAFARTATPQTKATEKEGYLYMPAPNFCPVYCTLSKGKIQVNREALNQPDLHLDLVICTVKENRDAKLRWCFNIISPSETLLLQADSAEGYMDWMNTIQNAIGMQLNAGSSRSTTKNAINSPNSAAAASAASPTGPASSPSHASHSSSASGSFSPGYSSASSASSAPNPHAQGQGSLFGKAGDGASSSAALSILRKVAGNDICADCSAKDPDWVSLNLGIVICMECSGVHRALGVHISKVRSTTLDKLDSYAVSYLASVGNVKANAVWEASLLLSDAAKRSRPNPSSNAAMREMWVRAKYDVKSFLSPTREKDKSVLNHKLFAAIEHGDLVAAMQSLAWGANPAWPNPAAEQRTALHQACMYSNLVLVECVIQFMPVAITLNMKELRGWTPIHYAAYQNDKGLVELLILRGGSQLACELDAGGNTPLSSALAQCAASGEAIVPEVQQLLQAAEDKVRARNAR